MGIPNRILYFGNIIDELDEQKHDKPTPEYQLTDTLCLTRAETMDKTNCKVGV